MRIAEPHPLVVEIVKEIDVDKSSNQQVHQFLNLKNEGYNMMESLETEVLESYFGPHSPSAKSYLTYGGKDVFFHDVARFLLDVVYVSPRQYCMPKQRAGFVIATYEGSKFNWGTSQVLHCENNCVGCRMENL